MPQVIDNLIRGYEEFRKNYFGQDKDLFEELVQSGQKPKVLIIACSDSRVDPAIVMNCQPGDLFVVRNVANLVPPYENDTTTHHGVSAALEFGIRVLGIQQIIVFGHTQCGGINALITGADERVGPNSFVARWMDLAQPAHELVLKHHADATLDEKITFCEQYAIRHSLRNLCTFPWIAEGVKAGKIFLHGWYFTLSTGTIQAFNYKQKNFEELKMSVEPYDL